MPRNDFQKIFKKAMEREPTRRVRRNEQMEDYGASVARGRCRAGQRVAGAGAKWPRRPPGRQKRTPPPGGARRDDARRAASLSQVAHRASMSVVTPVIRSFSPTAAHEAAERWRGARFRHAAAKIEMPPTNLVRPC